MRAWLLWAVMLGSAAAQDARAVVDRASADFVAGRIAESVRGFDEVVKLRPEAAPHLWQRGIALYYAERYKDCRLQFESHRTVNPNDVENAAWHFLCAARESSAEKAKQSLLPVGPDSRVPMRQVYQMFAGEARPDAVLKAAGTDASGIFYAHLYIGLYYEAVGKAAEALNHMRLAAQPRYAEYGGYMHDVARVHLSARRAK